MAESEILQYVVYKHGHEERPNQLSFDCYRSPMRRRFQAKVCKLVICISVKILDAPVKWKVKKEERLWGREHVFQLKEEEEEEERASENGDLILCQQ